MEESTMRSLGGSPGLPGGSDKLSGETLLGTLGTSGTHLGGDLWEEVSGRVSAHKVAPLSNRMQKFL